MKKYEFKNDQDINDTIMLISDTQKVINIQKKTERSFRRKKRQSTKCFAK